MLPAGLRLRNLLEVFSSFSSFRTSPVKMASYYLLFKAKGPWRDDVAAQVRAAMCESTLPGGLKSATSSDRAEVLRSGLC